MLSTSDACDDADATAATWILVFSHCFFLLVSFLLYDDTKRN